MQKKYDISFPFVVKAVVNKSRAYFFWIIGMIHLQKIFISIRMLRFHFFTAKQDTLEYINTTGVLFKSETQTVFNTGLVHVGKVFSKNI